MLRGTLADCSPHVVLADRSLATRVGGAGVKVTVGVRVSGVIRTTLADGVTVKARYYNQLLNTDGGSNLPAAVQSALIPQGLVEQGSSRHSENGSPM